MNSEGFSSRASEVIDMEKTTTRKLTEFEALALFKGWFNNKMMILLAMSQYPNLRKRGSNTDKQIIFLDDIEHHYLRERKHQKQYINAIRWLKAFFRIYPIRITSDRRKKAYEMTEKIYENFGFNLNWKVCTSLSQRKGQRR